MSFRLFDKNPRPMEENRTDSIWLRSGIGCQPVGRQTEAGSRCHFTMRIAMLVIATTVMAGCGREPAATSPVSVKTPPPPAQRDNGAGESREALIARSLQYRAQGNFAAAVDTLRKVIINDPQDYEAIFHLANTEAARGNLAIAIELLQEIPADHPQAGVPALGVSAQWCFQLERYADAEQRYRKILQIDPSSNPARRNLAYLLNRQGRRHEAVALIRQLCATGDVLEDELHALICEADAMFDSQSQLGQRTYAPVDEMGVARLLFTNREFQQAAQIIQPIVTSGEAPAAVIALFGRAAVEAQDEEKILLWRDYVNDQVKTFPDYWAAIGTYLMREGKFQPAVRALAEAVKLDPTDLQSIRRIDQGLRSQQRYQQADLWTERYKLVDRILQTSISIGAAPLPAKQDYDELVRDLESAGRYLEAILWRWMATTGRSNRRGLSGGVKRQVDQAIADQTAFPGPQQAWCGIDLGADPLPPFPSTLASLAPSAQNIQNIDGPDAAPPAAFNDVSQQIGLDHQFKIARQPVQKQFAIYQVYGGGVAVTDFDLDGQVDLYLTQGAADPDEFVAAQSDQLYRTIVSADTRQLRDVTDLAWRRRARLLGGRDSRRLESRWLSRFGGDQHWRQSTVDQSRRWDVSSPILDSSPNLQRLCTSVAMGDLTGDGLPDLFVLNFLRDPDIALLPDLDASGNVIDPILPLSVQPARDQLYVNNAAGQSHAIDVGDRETDARTGLGIVIADLSTDHAGNEVFVGNDAMANQLWVRDQDQALVDVAAALGCAFGDHGTATAAMGIAVGDLDRSGTIDLHISNFVSEPSSLYLNDGGIFRDLNVRFQLTADTSPMIGFGSQAIDYTNNGWLDLVVTNGDVEDLESRGQSFRQPLQLFANLGDHFGLAAVDTEFWNRPHVGRALARLDFNRDGQMDFVVTDLLEPSALLLNESPTSNHWVSLRLVGTESERDAIGAKVELVAGQQSWTGWVTAGDGYLCKNESVVHFGIAQQTDIQRVTVTWPSGRKQDYRQIPADSFVLLVEDESDAFVYETDE